VAALHATACQGVFQPRACRLDARSDLCADQHLNPNTISNKHTSHTHTHTHTHTHQVRPMLAKATNGVSEVLEKFSDCEFTCEYKYDGERCQIHVQGGGTTVALYSRNAEDQTPKYPDIGGVGLGGGWGDGGRGGPLSMNTAPGETSVFAAP